MGLEEWALPGNSCKTVSSIHEKFKISLTHNKIFHKRKKKTSRVGDLEMYISTLVGKPNTKAVKFLLA